MNTTMIDFQGSAAPGRTAIPNYRILRRMVAMRHAGVSGVHDTGSVYWAVSRAFRGAHE